jgi:hypothetical protein
LEVLALVLQMVCAVELGAIQYFLQLHRPAVAVVQELLQDRTQPEMAVAVVVVLITVPVELELQIKDLMAVLVALEILPVAVAVQEKQVRHQ